MPPDLAAVVGAWDRLAPGIREAIVALAKTATV
jgi:hypothetical protein